MARKRMISPEIWVSSSFAELSDFAKIVFIGLISNADDEGKGEADPALLKSTLFPRDEKKKTADVKSALSEIARSTSTLFYSVEGKNYYALTKWKTWQTLNRPTPSRIPDPPENTSVGERGRCTQNQELSEGSLNTHGGLTEYSLLIEKNRIEIEKNRKEIKEEINNTTQGAGVIIVAATNPSTIACENKAEAEAEWKSILDILEPAIASLSFDVWLRPITACGYYEGNLVLMTATAASRDEVMTRFEKQIVEARHKLIPSHEGDKKE